MKNIEIKARYTNIEAGKKIAEEMGAKYIGCDHQVDTYFVTPNGRFKLRESSISRAYLVPYIREDQTAAKSSSYLIIPVQSPEETKKLFTQILGVDSVVEKNRHIYLKGNVRIHLDEVMGLGTFFELEAVCHENAVYEQEVSKIGHLMETFNIRSSDLLSGSYREMLK